MKNLYALQPYMVGSKYNKSLALVIPAKVVKRYKITPSTVFALTTNEKDGQILLRKCDEIVTSRMEEEADGSSATIIRQASLS